MLFVFCSVVECSIFVVLLIHSIQNNEKTHHQCLDAFRCDPHFFTGKQIRFKRGEFTNQSCENRGSGIQSILS